MICEGENIDSVPEGSRADSKFPSTASLDGSQERERKRELLTHLHGVSHLDGQQFANTTDLDCAARLVPLSCRGVVGQAIKGLCRIRRLCGR